MVRQGDVDQVALGKLVARIFRGADCRIERAAAGVSTPVYRVRRGAEVFYLRLAETPEASLAPEARVHGLLREGGVRVPAVVQYEPFDEALQRSVLVTTEIAGEPVGCRGVDAATRAILRAAGRDLAAINSLPVAGFGWIRRDRAVMAGLAAEHEDRRAWGREYLDAVLALTRAGVLTVAQAAGLPPASRTGSPCRAASARGLRTATST